MAVALAVTSISVFYLLSTDTNLLETPSSWLARFGDRIREISWLLSSLRLIGLVSLFLVWERLLNLLNTKELIATHTTRTLIHHKGSILLWLTVIELVLGQQILQRLVSLA